MLFRKPWKLAPPLHLAGATEEPEVLLALVERPADGRVAEHERIVQLLPIGPGGEHLGDRAAVTRVAGEQVRHRLGRGRVGPAQQGHRLGDDRRRLQIDEQDAQFAVDASLGSGNTVELAPPAARPSADRRAHADEDERPGPQQFELLLLGERAESSRSSAASNRGSSDLSPWRASATAPVMSASGSVSSSTRSCQSVGG